MLETMRKSIGICHVYGCKHQLLAAESDLHQSKQDLEKRLKEQEEANRQVVELLREAQAILSVQFAREIREAERLMRRRRDGVV